jgi:hypothetical protein
MKRNRFLTTILTIFVTLFAVISPALAKEGRSIKFLGVNYWGGKGVVFKFEISGDFNPSELRGYARIGDHEFGLDCSLNDENILTCVAGDGIGNYVGQTATVVINGQAFYVRIPAKKDLTTPQYCYDIQGLTTDDINGFMAAANSETTDISTLLGYWHPAVVGSHCTDEQPQTGDIIDFNHPYEAQLDALFGTFVGGEIPDITVAMFVGSDITALGAPPELNACFVTTPSYYGYMRIITCEMSIFK